jgi:hypothetical protein
VFWIRFPLRPENKIKYKNYDKTLYIQYELGLTNANKGVLNQTIQDLSHPQTYIMLVPSITTRN